jgi:GT2 family glycosyltransferase
MDRTTQPHCAVVLVNYCRPEDTLACIGSLRLSTYDNFSITVVDNSPNDDLLRATEHQHPNITILSPGTNLGFAEGNNVGIRHVLNSSSGAVLLLNNDTEVEPGTLAALMQVLEEEPQSGIVGGKILYHSDKSRIWFAGGHFNIHAGFGGHDGIGKADSGQFDTRRECAFITGCCLLIRRSVLMDVGVLDERFFAYMEDTDYCYRARCAGYRVIYEPTARVYHKVSSTASWDSPVYLYFNCRNKLILIRKHTALLALLPHLPRLLWFYIRQMIRMAVKYRDWDGFQAVVMGITDGIAERTGVHGAGRLTSLGPGKKRIQ